MQDLHSDATGTLHQSLFELISNHTFVGMAGHSRALLQHKTGLYLVDTSALSYDLAYQQVLQRFEHLRCIFLEPAPRIFDLIMVALDAEEALGRWQVRQRSNKMPDMRCPMTIMLSLFVLSGSKFP